MRKKRAVRRLVGVTAAAMISAAISGGMAAPLGVAETLPGGDANQGIDPAITGATPTKAELRARCIRKAQTKFGDNRPKKKAAIKKCKKKYA
jgi:hypothetical protein